MDYYSAKTSDEEIRSREKWWKNVLMHNDRQYITNWHERYNIEVFKIAIENNIPVIDITTSFLEQKNYSDYLCDDGIHPNEKGHELIAEAIMQHVARKNIEFDRAI